VRGLVKRDGTVLYAFTYRPYGALADSAGSGGIELRYRWTGREWDAETGWYFHRSRYYDPAARRFVQEDRIGYAGGRNLYAYVDGRVLELVDPDGLAAEPRQKEPERPLVSLGELLNAEMDRLFGSGGIKVYQVVVNGQFMGNTVCMALLGCDDEQIDAMVARESNQWASRKIGGLTPEVVSRGSVEGRPDVHGETSIHLSWASAGETTPHYVEGHSSLLETSSDEPWLRITFEDSQWLNGVLTNRREFEISFAGVSFSYVAYDFRGQGKDWYSGFIHTNVMGEIVTFDGDYWGAMWAWDQWGWR